MYKLVLSPLAKQQLDRLPWKLQEKVEREIDEIRENPLSGKLLSGNLSGQFSVPVNGYRILYKIFPQDKKIFVKKIEHRATVYN